MHVQTETLLPNFLQRDMPTFPIGQPHVSNIIICKGNMKLQVGTKISKMSSSLSDTIKIIYSGS